MENASSLPPLTTGQKFKLVAQGTFDPVEFAFLGLEAGVNQASNTNPTFGQGLKGYGKRYALAFADNTIENFMAGAIFPSALRQDPRYYQLGKGSFLHRVGYAALRVVITRSDSGKTQFNFSEFLGSGTAAAISNAYHPGPRTLGSNHQCLGNTNWVGCRRFRDERILAGHSSLSYPRPPQDVSPPEQISQEIRSG